MLGASSVGSARTRAAAVPSLHLCGHAQNASPDLHSSGCGCAEQGAARAHAARAITLAITLSRGIVWDTARHRGFTLEQK